VNDHDPYPTADDAAKGKLVLKIQRPLGAPRGREDLDLRISPDYACKLKGNLVDNGFHVSDVTELSAGSALQVVATSLTAAGGVGALAYVVVEFLRKDHGKEYCLYVNDKRIQFKGLSVRQARRMLAEQAQAALGREPELGEDEHADKPADDELLE